MPGIITSLIIQGIFFWNDFFNPLVLVRSRRNFTLQLALAAFKGSFGFEIATLAAGVLLSLIPILIFYIVFADFVRRGIAGGVGIKGL